MKRTISKLVLFLTLGAILSIGVTWGFAWWGAYSFSPEESWPGWPAKPTFSWFGPHHPESFRTFRSATNGSGISLENYSVVSQRYDSAGELLYWDGKAWGSWHDRPDFVSRSYSVAWFEAGWPWRAMCGGEWTAQNYAIAPEQPEWRRQSMLVINASNSWPRWLATGPRIIPLMPLWPGFLLDSILYGVVIAVLSRGLIAGRHAIRRKRALCQHCNYPVGVSAVCTECGKPVTPRDPEKTIAT